MTSAYSVEQNLISTHVPHVFTGLYSLWDILFYSEQLVDSCTLLGLAIQTTATATWTSLFDISRVLNNFSNNFDDAYTSYADLRMFMTSPQVVETDYSQDSYYSGYAAGQVLYYLFVTPEFMVGDEPVDPYETLSNYEPEELD